MNSRGKPYSRVLHKTDVGLVMFGTMKVFQPEINIAIDASVCLVIHVL